MRQAQLKGSGYRPPRLLPCRTIFFVALSLTLKK
jgi:hypothetical protein